MNSPASSSAFGIDDHRPNPAFCTGLTVLRSGPQPMAADPQLIHSKRLRGDACASAGFASTSALAGLLDAAPDESMGCGSQGSSRARSVHHRQTGFTQVGSGGTGATLA